VEEVGEEGEERGEWAKREWECKGAERGGERE
jgi:hypothetical protein